MESLRGAADQCRSMASRMAAVPFVFLGVGLYRAWLALFFRYEAFPGMNAPSYFLFEAAIGVASFILALAARRICPIWSNRAVVGASWACMTCGAACIAAGCFGGVAPLGAVGLVLAGAGLAAVILMWAEFYGSINPARVALYHAMGIGFGEILKWLFMGMDISYLVFFSLVLPAACIATVHASVSRLPRDERPAHGADAASRVIPWKPIVLMAACSFAAAFGALPAQALSAGNVAGALGACTLVCVGVLVQMRWFNFDTVYELAFPLFIIAFLFVSPAVTGGSFLTAVGYEAGYTMLTILMVIVFGNITYRYGVNAVWACGIERGIRYVAESIGWGSSAVLAGTLGSQEMSTAYLVITFVVAAVFAVVFFSERKLSAQWGISLKDGGELLAASDERWRALRVEELSRKHDLSSREGEVLRLLVERKTMAEMEEALFIAQGTIKAHVSHIYKKLGVHSRTELFALFDDPERSGSQR